MSHKSLHRSPTEVFILVPKSLQTESKRDSPVELSHFNILKSENFSSNTSEGSYHKGPCIGISCYRVTTLSHFQDLSAITPISGSVQLRNWGNPVYQVVILSLFVCLQLSLHVCIVQSIYSKRSYRNSRVPLVDRSGELTEELKDLNHRVPKNNRSLSGGIRLLHPPLL